MVRHYATLREDELGFATLNEAISDIGIGEHCPNWGPEIKEYLARVGFHAPAPYCAAAVSDWMVRGGAKTSIQPPINPTAGAQHMMEQFKKVGRWIDLGSVTPDLVAPGMIPVWNRATEAEPWRGHVGVVERMGDDGVTFHTVEGNIITGPGQGVGRLKRRLDDATLFGFGILSGPMPWDPVPPLLVYEQPPVVQATAQHVPIIAGFALGMMVSVLAVNTKPGRRMVSQIGSW